MQPRRRDASVLHPSPRARRRRVPSPPLLGHVEVRRVEERAVLVVELGPALEDLLRARVDRVVVALDVGVGREVRRRERVRRGGRRVGRRERGRVAGRERRPRELGRVDLVEERVALDRPVPNSNLQLYFNVRVCDGFDATSLAWLRELDESNRFVQKSAESTSI